MANPSGPTEIGADPDFADRLPFVILTAGTPRVRPRTIVDLASGFDLTSARGRRTWTVQVQVTNLTHRTALYNFQSFFVGRRPLGQRITMDSLVQPCTASVRRARYF